MIINTNINSVKCSKILQSNNRSLGKAMNSLSSGLKINKASDDAAGLSISEKMKSQIRGLEKANNNSEDGISLLKVAEGGMNEISNILNRVRTLCVQSANGTNVDIDRQSIQDEVNELLTEIDNIADNTNYNNIQLLNGVGTNYSAITGENISDHVQYITSTNGMTDTYTYDGKNYASGIIDFSNINSQDDIDKLVGDGINYTCCSCTKAYSIKFVTGTPDTSRLNSTNPVMEVDVSGITTGEELAKKIMSTAYGEDGYRYNPNNTALSPLPGSATAFVKHYSKLDIDGSKLYIYDDRTSYSGSSLPSSNGYGRFSFGVYGESAPVGNKIELNLQIGANKGESLTIYLPNVKTNKLGLGAGISTMSSDDSNSSLSKLDDAIKIVNSSRSSLGAYENRLEHISTINALAIENTESAKSSITDCDMAESMMDYSKQSILMQSVQAMLSQSNNMNQSILNLINT